MVPGLGVTLFADQAARQVQLGVTRFRITLDKALQKSGCLTRRRARQELRLEQSRHFPIRAQLERAADLSERAFEDARRTGGHGHGVMRFGHTEKRPANLVDQAKDCLPVGVARKHSIEAQQAGAQ